jgi:hypothetical protein
MLEDFRMEQIGTYIDAIYFSFDEKDRDRIFKQINEFQQPFVDKLQEDELKLYYPRKGEIK